MSKRKAEIMDRSKWRLVFVLLLIICSTGSLSAKKRSSRTELEYRVEQLEKQNAELRRELEDLNTKLEMIQIRLNACAEASSGTQKLSAQASDRTAEKVNPPSIVPNHLEVIKISPELEKKQTQQASPFMPQIKHYISSSPSGDSDKHAKPGLKEVEVKQEKTSISESELSQASKGQVIVVSSEAEAEALKHGPLKNGEGGLIVVRSEDGDEQTQTELAATRSRESASSEEVTGEASAQVSNPSDKTDEAVFEVYQEALKLYEEKQYQEAKTRFEAFISSYPESSYLDNAYYWLGECYFDEQDYDRAIDVFSKVTEAYQHSSKAADALYKIGICHLRQNRMEEGIDTLEEVMLLYPYSDAAKLAEEKIEEVTD